MRIAQFVPGLRIGTKLGICVGIGGALVVALIIHEQTTSHEIERLTAAADRQQTIVIDSITTEAVLQRVLVVGRDIRMARTAAEVERLVLDLRQIARAGTTKIEALEEQSIDSAH